MTQLSRSCWAALLVLAAPVALTAVRADVVVQYDFNDFIAGHHFPDLSGNGRDLKMHRVEAWSSGPGITGAEGDLSVELHPRDEEIAVGRIVDPTGMPELEEFTLEVWIANGNEQGQSGLIANFVAGDSWEDREADPKGQIVLAVGPGGHPMGAMYNDQNKAVILTSPFALPVDVNQWHHVALMYDGAVLTLYVHDKNGKLVAEESQPCSGRVRPNLDCFIGHHGWADSFAGRVDHLRLSDRALKPVLGEDGFFKPE